MNEVELDPEIAALLAQEEGSGGVALEELGPEQARRDYELRAREQFGPVAELGSVEDVELDGVPARVYTPLAPAGGALVYFHGGGWVIGSVDSHDGVTRAFADRASCVVVSVDYRLAPEHRFPAALEDAWRAARWVRRYPDEFGVDPARIAVGGDSAGGTLAAVVARMGRDHALPFAAQLLLYPVVTTCSEAPSWSLFANGYGLSSASMEWYGRQYLGDVDGAADPDVSPLALGDLRGLPRAVVVTAEADVLRDDAEEYARRLELAGVEAELRRYEGMIHGFLRMPGVVARAETALSEIADSLRAALAQRETVRTTPLATREVAD